MAQLPSVELISGFLRVQFPYNKEYIAAVKAIGYARWDSAGKSWILPNSTPNLEALKKAFPSLVVGPNLRGENKVETENLMEAELRKYIPKQRDVEITDFKFHTAPQWHQKVTFNFARSLDSSAIFLEQGLGKTKIIIDLVTWRFRKGQVRRSFYVAPNSVVPQWGEDDVRQHLHPDFKGVKILEGSSKQKIKTLEQIYEEDEFEGFIIVNFEALLGLETFLLKIQDGKKTKLFQHMNLDESSKIKHATSARSKITWKVGKTLAFRNIMTGTPITQTAEDAFSQYRFLNDRIFGPYATAFRGTYLILGGFENRQIVGYRNIGQFFEKLFSAGIRFTKDMCLNLPAKVYQKRYARLDEDVSKKYKQLEKECIAEFGGKEIAASLVLTKLIKLSQITGGFIYEQDATGAKVATHTFKTSPKLEVLEEILDEVLPNKIIVWCRFVHELEIITSMIKARMAKEAEAGRRLKFAAIHGGVPKEERGKQVSMFQNDPECQIFVGQVTTAGLGITLTAATYVVYYSNTYSLEDRLQSEDRCHRIGQTKSVTYIDILATLHSGKKTIDHDTLEIIKSKNTFANEVSRALVSRMMDRDIDKVEGEDNADDAQGELIQEGEF